jgi:NDP-sugar pyrophosphorylase family protein
LGHLVKAVIGDGSKLGAEVDYVEEIEPLGTAGCLDLINFENDVTVVLVINGDTYTDFDFQLGVTELIKRSSPGVIVTASRSVQSEFGVVEIKENGELDSFSEKPIIIQQVSTGINYFEVASLKKVRQPGKLDMPELLMKIHLTSTIGVYCLENKSTWFDLGRPQDLILANEHFISNFG